MRFFYYIIALHYHVNDSCAVRVFSLSERATTPCDDRPLLSARERISPRVRIRGTTLRLVISNRRARGSTAGRANTWLLPRRSRIKKGNGEPSRPLFINSGIATFSPHLVPISEILARLGDSDVWFPSAANKDDRPTNDCRRSQD